MSLYAAFLDDSLALVRSVSQIDLTILVAQGSRLLDYSQASSEAHVVCLPDLQPAAIAQYAARTFSRGTVLILSGAMPHLPVWRLRDTLTYLDHGADVVIGPGERGDWYLIGLRTPHPALLRTLPAADSRPDDLCIAAATYGLRVEQLPAWYTLSTLADLDRLMIDLRTMPPDVAPNTRRMLNGDGIGARAVGG
ncbi:MAG: DUF2064 domain-containing protein [Oscillochloris sp.]|nr:DUF2064 domain-containing protein [Oscillochloris sp.]